MAVIRVLPPEVAGKIAAGEVVERPASVVRELLDNALDAGATQVTVEIAGGGIDLIRVADNGRGIPSDQVEQAFLRHATSKLASLDDLDGIATLGFRGEALPSIAAVGDVTLSTCTNEDTAGTRVRVINGVLAERGAAGVPAGTVVTVRDLFGSVPARRKFLKSPQSEANQINLLLDHYALAAPQVAFTLLMDGRRAFQTPGDGNLRTAAAAVFGAGIAGAMLYFSGGDAEGTVTAGLLGPPSVNRGNRTGIAFFVNRRWIQSRALMVAVEEAYHGMMMVGRSPLAVVHLTVPPGEVDVNVHPSKREVRFLNERALFQTVQRAVRGRLIADSPVVQASGYAPAGAASHPAPEVPSDRLLLPDRVPQHEVSPLPARTASRVLPVLRVVGQVALTYVIAEGPDGMYLVDQHAAHERVLYDEALGQDSTAGLRSQGLLESVTVELTGAQFAQVEAAADSLRAFGYHIEAFGGRSLLVRAVPAALAGRPVADTLRAVLDDERTPGADLQHRLAASIACHSAVRAGDSLSDEQMRSLIRQLEETAAPQTCPHGRPTMVHMPAVQLERQFGRRG